MTWTYAHRWGGGSADSGLRRTEMTTTRPSTMCEAFQRTAAIDPDTVALRTPGGTQSLTWREYAAQVRQVAAGLAGLGGRRGGTGLLMVGDPGAVYPPHG